MINCCEVVFFLIYLKLKGDIILIMRTITPLGLSRLLLLLLLIYTNILYMSATKTKLLTPRSWKVEWYSVLRHYVHIQQGALLISVNERNRKFKKQSFYTVTLAIWQLFVCCPWALQGSIQIWWPPAVYAKKWRIMWVVAVESQDRQS